MTKWGNGRHDVLRMMKAGFSPRVIADKIDLKYALQDTSTAFYSNPSGAGAERAPVQCCFASQRLSSTTVGYFVATIHT